MYRDYIKSTAYIYWKKLNGGERVPREEASLAGKDLLKAALWDVFGLEMDELSFGTGAHGKPFVVDHPEVQYNISHSGCYLVCAVSGVPVGIDIQEKRVIALDKLGRKVFSPEEYREFLKSEDKQDMFFRQWVKAESYIKWTGEGFSRDLTELPMDGWHQFVHINRHYNCAIWSQGPLSIFMREM